MITIILYYISTNETQTWVIGWTRERETKIWNCTEMYERYINI